MIWKNYSHLSGSHAFLSPSKHSWLNYSPEKLAASYENYKKIALGTQYHKVAAELIRLAIRLPNTAASLNAFVNDAIGFKMSSEVVLYHSVHCYGTADAIAFNDGVLRIHDLKTGVSPASINQVLVYAGLFCLDYELEPKELNQTELRIYQNEEIVSFSPTTKEVFDIVFRIAEANDVIERLYADWVL
jgi:hypothetical protein